MTGRPFRLAGRFAAVLGLVFFAASAGAVEVKRVVSPGGVEAWLVHDASVPVTAIEFSFRGGRAHDPKAKAGLANLVSGLLDEGAGALDSQAFQSRLQDLSIRMNFAAGRDTFRGSLKTLNRHRAEAVRLLRMALTAPRFDAEPVERIRAQIMVSLKRRSMDPNYVAGRVWGRAVYGDHPYGQPSEGTLETINKIETADLRAFVKNQFARNLLIVGVTGDITAAELAPLLDEVFGGLPERAEPATLPAAKLNLSGETYVVEMNVPQSAILFGQPGLARSDPDWYTALVANYILGGGGFASRLYREVREKRGLVYSIGSYLHPMRLAALIAGSAGTKNARAAESLKIIRREWGRLRDGGVTVRELADAKTYLTGSFPLRLSSTDRIARMLVSLQYHELGIDYLKKRSSYINAVTGDDVARVARRLLDPKSLTFVLVGKPVGVKATAPVPEI